MDRVRVVRGDDAAAPQVGENDDDVRDRDLPAFPRALGDVVIALADLRGRCIVTTYDPDTVDPDVGVLLGIRAQFGGTLALNAWAGRPGRIAVGDAAELLDAERPVDVPLVGRFA